MFSIGDCIVINDGSIKDTEAICVSVEHVMRARLDTLASASIYRVWGFQTRCSIVFGVSERGITKWSDTTGLIKVNSIHYTDNEVKYKIVGRIDIDTIDWFYKHRKNLSLAWLFTHWPVGMVS